MSDIDHSNTSEAVCPHCGNEMDYTYELFFSSPSEVEWECEECGKPFVISQDLTVTYNTRTPQETTK